MTCFLALWLAASARGDDKAQISGHWDFNQDQSDDAQQKVQDAQQNSRVQASNPSGGGYPGSGGGTYPGGGGVYYPGAGRGGMGGMGGMGMPGGGMGRGGRQSNRGDSVSSDEWDRLAANPKYLRIEQHDDQVVVGDDSDHTQTFYTDGKKHDDKDADGKKITTKSSWEGGAFVAETRLPHSDKLTQTFRVSEDGKQLFVTTRFDASSLAGPVSIRRVYDMQKAHTQ
jgi:hypothetical protein